MYYSCDKCRIIAFQSSKSRLMVVHILMLQMKKLRPRNVKWFSSQSSGAIRMRWGPSLLTPSSVLGLLNYKASCPKSLQSASEYIQKRIPVFSNFCNTWIYFLAMLRLIVPDECLGWSTRLILRSKKLVWNQVFWRYIQFTAGNIYE